MAAGSEIVQVSEILAWIASVLEEVPDGSHTFRESSWPAELLGTGPETMQHRAFALSTEAGGVFSDTDRQNRSVGGRTTTTVTVRFLYRLQADGMRDSYRAAHDMEQRLVAAALARPYAGTHIRIRSIDGRDITGDTEQRYLLGTFSLGVAHRYPLS